MRRTTAALLALGAAITVTAITGLTTPDAAPACPHHPGCVIERLPAPVTITAGPVSYRIARDSRARRVTVPGSRYPADLVWFPGTGTWFELRDRDRRVAPRGRGVLVVGRVRSGLGRHALWRSRARLAADRLGLIAAGPRAAAFQYDHRLYLATYGHRARPVAARELPLGWTTGGLYAYSYPRRELLLRRRTGAILKVIARRPSEYDFDLAAGSLYFLRQGVLGGAHGDGVWRIGSLRGFGMSADTYLQPIGGLIELLDNGRLSLVRPNGSLFATTPAGGGGISGSLAVAPDRSAVAFTVDTGPAGRPNGRDIELLSAGGQAAVTVGREPGAFAGCAQGVGLQWHRRWLLYGDSSGDLAVIDTTGTRRTIQLSGLVHRLLGTRGGVDARWSR